MRPLFALILTLFTTAAPAKTELPNWKKHPESIVVKVYSCFSKNPEDCLEGTGVLVRVPEYGGNVDYIRVVTSEHVVLPTNDGVYHRVVDSRGRTSQALFYRSNWENGIALLGINETEFTKDLDRKKDFPYLKDYQGRDEQTQKELSAIGFPAGSQRLVRSDHGQSLGWMRDGRVLGDWKVIETRGLSAEFGMSGGPVFTADGNLFGVLSHVSFDADPKTYVIPIATVADWTGNAWNSDFYRTVDDYKLQFFSRSKMERVRIRGLEMVIEKNGGRFTVTLPDSWRDPQAAKYKILDLSMHRERLGSLVTWMLQTDLKKIVFDHRAEGGDLSSLSIETFVGSYASDRVPFQTPEGLPADPGHCDPRLHWFDEKVSERFCNYASSAPLDPW